MKRRQFLQASGSAIATLAFDQIINHADRYGRVLAQNGGRKLALLVGINDYLPGDRNLAALEGCTNDVDLQKELLTYRFGFDPNAIAVLKNKAATRQNILQAFEQHLIKQAKPGDVVVFHFSGHGSRVLDPDPIGGKPDNSTFLPYGAEFINPDGTVNDIMGRTLFLLMSALQTRNITAVLDSCHAGGGTRGMGTVRSGDETSNRKPSREELTYQNTLRQRLNLSPQQLREARSRSVAKGAVIAATQPDLLAMDWLFGGQFHAGAFTYLLTQYLWSQPSTYGEAEDVLRRSLYSLTRYQSPVFDLEQPTLKSQPLYFTQSQRRSAQAVVTSINGSTAQLWLGGLDPILTLAPGSTFAAIDPSGIPTGTVKLQSRAGLTATASIQGAVGRGALLQETDRLIPNTLQLRIGIDASIGREIPAVQAALSKTARIEAVPARSGARPYPNGVDFIISRVTEKYRSYSRSDSKLPINSVGIFSPILEVLPNTIAKPGESAEAAIARLQVRLQSLVAAYVVRKTLNAESSSLNVNVKLQRQDQPGVTIAQAATQRNGKLSSQAAPIELNAAFQFQVANNETTPLYLLIALVSPSGKLSILFPNDYTTGGSLREVSQITPQTARLIPDRQDGDEFQFKTQLPGQSEALIITSRKPLDTVYKRVQTLASEQALKRGVPLNERGSGDAIAGLLADLSRNSSSTAFTVSNADVATLSMPFIVKG